MAQPFTTVPGHIGVPAHSCVQHPPAAPKHMSIGLATGKAEALRAAGAAYTYAL